MGSPVVCIYLGKSEECQNCGGWTKAGGYRLEPDGSMVRDATVPKGPFEGDPRFCSEDCYADHQKWVEREERARASEYCQTCGFDRHEHAPDCAAAA